MKMCNECFELFDDSVNLEDCPIFHCEGELITIDSEIAWPIAEINKQLVINDLPVRTAFCCSGHYPRDSQAYIGFGVDDCFFDNEEEAKEYMQSFIDTILKKPLEKLNNTLSSSPYFSIKDSYKTDINVLTQQWKECCDDVETLYRIFVSDFTPKYNDDVLKDKIKLCRAISFIQNAFKEFLLDLIESIEANTSKELTVDSLCEDE